MSMTLDEHRTTVISSWTSQLDALLQRLSPRFSRTELRRRLRTYLLGLLSSTERKNSWQLAEAAGDANPYGIQHLLGRANWDPDLVPDDLRSYVTEHLGEEGILLVDETGFLKKGQNSVGVARQYCGTAGKVENCQVGVFLCYATNKGAAFIDRELYLPEEEWALDLNRREKAGVPQEVKFATKPQLAQQMLKRALDGGVSASWVVADCHYGDARYLGVFLEEKEQPYVLGVSGKAYVWMGLYQPKVSEILFALREGSPKGGEGEEDFRRLSCAKGSKGERLYEWLRLKLNEPLQEGFSRWLLVRRQIEDPSELCAYVVFAPQETSLEQLVKVAGSRWQVEVAFEGAKGEVGLDDYEVRSWAGWYRHITLSLFAHAFLSAIRARGLDIEMPPKKGEFFGQQTSPASRSKSLAAFKRRRGL